MERFSKFVMGILLAGGLLASCQVQERSEYPFEGAEGIVLNFRCCDPSLSKAGMNGVREGEEDWNENRIDVVDIFFYPEDKLDRNAVFHERFAPGDPDGEVSLTSYTSDNFINTILMPTSSESFYVYAIANYPSTIVANENNLDGTSIASLKQLTLNCDFSAAAGHKQSNFVMDGLARVTEVDKNARLVAKGMVKLRRVAAKISIQLNIPDSILVERFVIVDDDTTHYYETWKPMIEGMQLYIENGVRNTTVAGKPVDNPVYFSYKNNCMYFTKNASADAEYPWFTDPTYVYPQRWEYASQVSPTLEPDLKLILPWRRLERTDHGIQVKPTQKQFYYKIIVPEDTRQSAEDTVYLNNFVRNNWYRFKMDVGILGSETDDATIQIPGHYYVCDWQDKNIVIKQAVIGKARFLAVDQKSYTLNNVEDLSITYTSSHPVSLYKDKAKTTLDIRATKIYYGSLGNNQSYSGGIIKTAGTNDPYPSGTKFVEYNETQRKAKNNGTDWVTLTAGHIVFNHILNNDFTNTDFDSAPYIITFSVYHSDHVDDASYKATVTITQKPAIYIAPEENSDFALSGSSTSNVGNHKGYVYVNGAQGTGDSNWYVVRGLAGNNKNYNMYVITVTVLDETSSYILGDPRKTEVDNLSYTFASLPAVGENSNRRLTYYYPTDDSQATANVIAPVYRVASSYGVCGNAISLENAKNRCASYQEDGYPSGRWRVPTRAEVEFITTLSANNVIPTLFNVGGNYFSAHGAVTPQNNGTVVSSNSSTAFVRCVYDEWYWSDKVNSGTPTWGDATR